MTAITSAYDHWVLVTGSKFSKALWAKYTSGKMEAPNREMRNELRALVRMSPLPSTVMEAIGMASPDAEVVRIGEQRKRM